MESVVKNGAQLKERTKEWEREGQGKRGNRNIYGDGVKQNKRKVQVE